MLIWTWIQKLISGPRYRIVRLDSDGETAALLNPKQNPSLACFEFEILRGEYTDVRFRLLDIHIVENIHDRAHLEFDYIATRVPPKYAQFEQDSLYGDVGNIVLDFITLAIKNHDRSGEFS